MYIMFGIPLEDVYLDIWKILDNKFSNLEYMRNENTLNIFKQKRGLKILYVSVHNNKLVIYPSLIVELSNINVDLYPKEIKDIIFYFIKYKYLSI